MHRATSIDCPCLTYADSNSRSYLAEPLQLLKLCIQPVEDRRFPGLALQHHEFAQGALMEFVAGVVAFEFLQPPGAAMRWLRAVLAAAMTMPETAVDEDGCLVFRNNNVGSHKPTPDPSTEWNGTGRVRCPLRDGDFHIEPIAKTEPMQKGADALFRRRILPSDPGHVPTAPVLRQTVAAPPRTVNTRRMRRLRAEDAAHVPGTVLARKVVFIHWSFLPRIDTDAHGCAVICVVICVAWRLSNLSPPAVLAPVAAGPRPSAVRKQDATMPFRKADCVCPEGDHFDSADSPS